MTDSAWLSFIFMVVLPITTYIIIVVWLWPREPKLKLNVTSSGPKLEPMLEVVIESSTGLVRVVRAPLQEGVIATMDAGERLKGVRVIQPFDQPSDINTSERQ